MANFGFTIVHCERKVLPPIAPQSASTLGGAVLPSPVFIDIRSVTEEDQEWLFTLHSNPVFNRWIGRSLQKLDELADDVSLRLQAETSGRGKTLVAFVGATGCGYGTV